MTFPSISTPIRRSLLLAVFAALSITFSARAHAQGVILTCTLLDPATGRETKTVAPGGTVTALLTVSVPDAANGAFIGVNASAKLSFAGIDIPYKIPVTDVTGANSDPEDGKAGLQNGQLRKEIRIPNFVHAGSSLKVVAQATVLNLTSNVCKVKLKVE